MKIKDGLKWFFAESSVVVLTLIITSIYDKINKLAILSTFINLLNKDLKVWLCLLFVNLPFIGYFTIKKFIEISHLSYKEKYIEIIDNIAQLLELENWNWFIDNAMRGIVHERFLDARDNIVRLKMMTVWPNKNTNLENKIKYVIDSFEFFIKKTMEHSETREEYLKPVQFYKTNGQFNPNYDKDLLVYKAWQQLCFNALSNYVYALNDLVKYIHKIYGVNEGRLKYQFLMDDNFGIYDKNLIPNSYMPLKKMKNT